MSNLVVVAIPDENDRVWKVSSEKVPHLTLLFLGDMANVAHLDQIVQFVEHAAKTTLSRFYLPVDRRGELGDDPQKGPADVLFFKKNRYDYKAIHDFRVALLQDNNIKTAYDSAQQFEGPWQPHLTLGYKTTPAKPDPEGYPFYDIQFNKIAVWTGDFEGPEFLLKDYWDDFEALELVPMDVAMSSMTRDDARAAAGLDAIEHFGVKGMKWGVRKEQVKSGVRRVATAVKDANFEANAETGDAAEMVRGKAHADFHKHDLPSINAKPEYQQAKKLKNRLTNRKDPITKQYRNEVKAAYIKRLETTANSMTNASGTRQYTIRERGDDLPAQGGDLPRSKYYWEVTSRKIQHAADPNKATLEVIMDADGFITELRPVGDSSSSSMAQSALYGETFVAGLSDSLAHHGIKGMRWGHRKAEPSAVAPTAASRVPHGDKRKTTIEVQGGENHPAHSDAIKVAQARAKLAKSGPAALSNQELRDVATRIQLETQVKTLTRSSGHKFVRNLLGQQGKEAANQAVRQQVKKRTSFA